MVDNHRKSLIQHCERSELRLHFEWTIVNKKIPKMVQFGEILIGQKLVEIAKMKKNRNF